MAHLPPDLRDHFFALGNVRFEALNSLAPHASQCELKKSELLQRKIVQILSDAHPLISANMLDSGPIS